MVVGSYASMVRGEPRTTHDVDLVIDPSGAQLDQFLAMVDVDAYYMDADVARNFLRRRSMFNLIDMTTGWKVDPVIRKDRPFSVAELDRRVLQQIVDVELPTATAEDTIIAKLEWRKRAVQNVSFTTRLASATPGSISRPRLHRGMGRTAGTSSPVDAGAVS